MNQYKLVVEMARTIQNMPARYRVYFSQWRNLTTAPDVCQNTTPWVNAVNTGAPAAAMTGYQRATNQLKRYSADAIAAMNPEQLQRATADYASVELTDGVSTNRMTTIGNIRADAQALQRQIANLEQDSLSSHPTLNSEVGVLNKINATNVLMLRTLQDANNLQLADSEQQLLHSKQTCDDLTDAINSDVYQRDHMLNQVNQVTTGLGAALHNYRMP